MSVTHVRVSARELSALLGLPQPTEEQTAVIESPLRPAVVIAGAGSGKTETMAARVVWLVANRLVKPEAVLGLTFTRKAAAELERDSPGDQEHLTELVAGEPTVLTYAAYAGRLVAEHALRLGAEPDARLISQAVSWQLADQVSRNHSGKLPRSIGAPSSVPQYVLAMSGQFADHLVDIADVERFCQDTLDVFHALPIGAGARSERPGNTDNFVDALEHRNALLPLVREFATAKGALPAVDFADQMTLAARLAGLPEVAAIERERFAAVLLDEYQDTGHAEVETLRGLFGDGHPVATRSSRSTAGVARARATSAGSRGHSRTPMATRPACSRSRPASGTTGPSSRSRTRRLRRCGRV